MTDVQLRIRDFTLPNGMRIIVQEEKSSPVVGIFSVIGCGSVADPVGREGLAHLVEHLAFRGKPDGKNSWQNLLDQAGAGMWNATTSRDETMYFSAGSKELYEGLLTVEASRLVATVANVDQKVLDVEREVVRNELRQRGEMAIGPEFAWLQEAVFPKEHPYHRPTVGTHESLNAITLDDVNAFVAKCYRPDNITMLISGDVDLTHFEKVLDARMPPALYTLPEKPLKAEPRIFAMAPEPPNPDSPALTRHNAAVSAPELYIAWSMPRDIGENASLIEFVSRRANQLLSKAARSDDDMVGVNVFHVPGVDASMLIVRAQLKEGSQPEKSVEHVLNLLVELSTGATRGNIDDSHPEYAELRRERDFGRFRNAAMMSKVLEAQDVMESGPERVRATHFTGERSTFASYIHSFDKLTSSQTNAFAGKYLTRERARSVLVEPFPPEAKNTLGTTGLSSPLQNEGPKVNYPASAVLALRDDWRTNALEEVLPSKLQVVIVPRPGLPVVSVVLGMPRGNASGQKGAAMWAESVAQPRSLRSGDPEDDGMSEQWSIRNDLQLIAYDGANGNLPNALAHISESIPSLYVESGAISTAGKYVLPTIEAQEAAPDRVAARQLNGALYPGHRLGETAVVADLREVSSTQVETWMHQTMVPDGAVLVIVGAVEPQKAMAQVKDWLGSWSGNSSLPLITEAPVAKTDNATLITNRPGATQANFTAGCRSTTATAKDLAAQEVLASLISAELNTKIRQNLGASYGIHGTAQAMTGGTTSLHIGGAIDNAKLPAALKIISTTWLTLGKKGLTEQEFGAARWSAARGETLMARSSSSLARSVAVGLLHGETTAEIESWAQRYAEVSKADVMRVWKVCHDSTVFSFVGDEAVIKAAIAPVMLRTTVSTENPPEQER